jgi:hypothetical protein
MATLGTTVSRGPAMRRREYLKTAVAAPLLTGAVYQQTDDESTDGAYTVLQGTQGFGVVPFRGTETVESFYQYKSDGQPHSHFEESREETSLLMLYRGPEGTSLVVSHDEQDHSASTELAGTVKAQFEGLPEKGSWVVQDDPGDFRRSQSRSDLNWRWNDKHTDGGAFRGGVESARITMDPTFETGIERWVFLSAMPGSSTGPLAIPLDPTQPVTVAGPEANPVWILPDTKNHVNPLSVVSNRSDTVNLQVTNSSTDQREGLELDASAADPTADSGEAAQSSVPSLEVTGTTPEGTFSVPANGRRDADVAVSTGAVAGQRQLSADVTGDNIEETVTDQFEIDIVEPVSLDVRITSEKPAVTGRDLVLEFEVTANDVVGVEQPELTVGVSDLPRGWDPQLGFADSAPDGGEWTMDGGDVRWSIDRLAPGLTLTPKLRITVPEGGSESESTLRDNDQLRPPSGDFEAADAQQVLDTTVTVPDGDGGRQTVQEVTTEIPVTEKLLDLTLETPDERFAGGGRIPIDVVIEPNFDGTVEVDSFSLEVSGVPLTDPDVPEDSAELVDTSEGQFQDLLRTETDGLDSTVKIERYAQPVEVSTDDPIEVGFEFEPPVSVDAEGTHDLVAVAPVQRQGASLPTRYSDIDGITIGDTAALGRLAIDCSEQIDDIAQPEGTGETFSHGPINETPEVPTVVEDILDAADDDNHPLTVDRAGDALQRLYQGERVIKRTLEATEPTEAGDEYNLCWRTAKSMVKVITIVGIVGKVVDRVAKGIRGAADDAGEAVGKFLANDIGGGLVVSTAQNLGSVTNSLASGAEDAADAAVEKTGPIGEGAAAGGEFVVDLGSDAANAVTDAGKGAVDAASKLVGQFAQFAQKLLPGGELLSRIGEKAFGSVWDAVSGVFGVLSGKLEAGADAVVESPSALGSIVNGGIGFVVDQVKDKVVRPLADELYKLIKSNGSLLLKTNPLYLTLGEAITPLQAQFDRLVERYADPDSVADGLTGSQDAAATMGSRGTGWIRDRGGVTKDAHDTFSQGVTDLPDLGEKYLDVFEQTKLLAEYLGDTDWENAVPQAKDVIGSMITYLKDLAGVVGGLTYGPVVNTAVSLWSTMELTVWSDFALKGIEQGEKKAKTDILEALGA